MNAIRAEPPMTDEEIRERYKENKEESQKKKII